LSPPVDKNVDAGADADADVEVDVGVGVGVVCAATSAAAASYSGHAFVAPPSVVGAHPLFNSEQSLPL
jgi:hypothetical protein